MTDFALSGIAVAPAAVRPGRPLTLSISGLSGNSRIRSIGVDLRAVTPADTRWVMGIGMDAKVRRGSVTAEISDTKSLPVDTPLEVHRIQFRSSSEASDAFATFVGGRDFHAHSLSSHENEDSQQS